VVAEGHVVAATVVVAGFEAELDFGRVLGVVIAHSWEPDMDFDLGDNLAGVVEGRLVHWFAGAYFDSEDLAS